MFLCIHKIEITNYKSLKVAYCAMYIFFYTQTNLRYFIKSDFQHEGHRWTLIHVQIRSYFGLKHVRYFIIFETTLPYCVTRRETVSVSV
jgi:hypothetical protein